MEGFDLEGVMGGTPNSAAVTLARRYMIHREARRVAIGGQRVPHRDLPSIEGMIVDAAHRCYERFGEAFRTALSAVYPTLYSKVFPRGSPLHQD